MPLDEVLARGFSYIMFSGDEAVDRHLAAELTAEVHYAVAPPPSEEHEHATPVASYGGLLATTSAFNLLYGHCTGQPRVNVNGSYLVGPLNGTRYRA